MGQRADRPGRPRTSARAHARAHGKRSDALLRSVAPVLLKSGDEFLPAVVEEVARILQATVVIVGEFVGDNRLRSVAFWRDGGFRESIEYPLTQPPCAVFGETGECVAVPLIGAKNTQIGVMCAYVETRLGDPDEALSLLQLFAGRVAAEMQRAITERELRESEAHLHAVQRVDALGRLAGNIAHDFNNLLMVVIGYAEILRSKHGPGNELTQLLVAADRASTLTRQLLAFGRRQLMEVQRIDLNRVVTQVQAMLTRVLGVQVSLTTTLDPNLPSVEADPGQLEQVLVNLAINARDAMPEGGMLNITTRVEEVVTSYNQMPPGRYVCVAVSDTGTGMTPDVLRQIFEPYFTTKGSGGTGLGLSSVYGIIKQSGGYIWCDSTPGTGTTFRIYLPPANGVAPERPDTDAATAAAPGGAETILVVDDERAVRELLTIILRGRGYTVIPAPDAKTALEVLQKPGQRIDLVVSDVVMPGMSGTRLVEDIQQQWPGIKLLLVSGHSHGISQPDHGTRKVPLLGKPFTPARLEKMVRDVLDGVEIKRPRVQPE